MERKMAEKIIFDHAADSVGKAISGVNFDDVPNVGETMTKKCSKFSEYAEFIHDNIENPTALYLFTRLILEGLTAMGNVEKVDSK
jgi:hypothetical protein